jgi:hypothetical protein
MTLKTFSSMKSFFKENLKFGLFFNNNLVEIMLIDISNIETWLDKMDYFEFSKLLGVNHNPLSITLGYQSEDVGGKFNRIRITPIDVKHWKYKETKKFFPSETTDIRQIDLVKDIDDIIKLRFIHSFAEVQLECKQFETNELPPVEIKPILNFNETWVTLSAPNKKLIKPLEWLEILKQRQFDVSFRLYGGEPKDVNLVPEDYTGYFISKNDRINENLTGIFISAAKSTSNSMYNIFECQDSKSYDLWIELIDIFSEIENSEIMIGDVIINNKIWKNQFANQYKRRL